MGIESKIQSWSESLANRIAESKFFDVDEMKVAIATHMKLALHDCLKDSISETEKKVLSKKLIIENSAGANTERQKAELIQLKAKLKAENIMRSELEGGNNEKLRRLILWVKEHDPNMLQQFYNSLNNLIL